MSIGWMMQVAAMPLSPPLKNGLAAFQTGVSAMVLVMAELSVCVDLSLGSTLSASVSVCFSVGRRGVWSVFER